MARARSIDWAKVDFVAMMMSWMFDFRAESAGAGAAIQIFFLLTFALSILFLFRAMKRDRFAIAGYNAALFATALFLVVGIVSGVMGAQESYQIARNAISIVVYFLAIMATAKYVQQCDPTTLRYHLSWLCAGFSLTSLVSVFVQQGGIDFSQSRFEILGPSVVAGLSYSVCFLLTNLTRLERATLLANLALVFLSITRTFILIIPIQMLPASSAIKRLLTPRMLIAGLAAISVILAFAGLSQTGFDRWNQRLFQGPTEDGEDVTYLTRKSETEFMLNAFLSSPETILIGNGMAKPTVYYIPKAVGGGQDSDTGFGHNQHASLLFIGGMIGGLPLLAVQFIQLLSSMQFLRQVSKRKKKISDEAMLAAWGATIIIGHFIFDFTASTFGVRGGALWYGVGTGLFLGARARIGRTRLPGGQLATEAEATPEPQGARPVRDTIPAPVRRRREWLAGLRASDQ